MMSAAGSPSPPRSLRTVLRTHLLPILTPVQRVTSPFIAVFLVVHLSAPVAALSGGSDATSRMILLGREYYQQPLTEPLLVWAPLILHTSSSILKRLLLVNPSKPSKPRTLQTTAYALLALFLPTHILIHRFYPLQLNLSDRVDADYIKWGMEKWPKLSWIMFGGLTITTILHWAEGGRVLNRVWGPSGGSTAPKASPSTGEKTRRLLHPMVGVSLAVATGIGSILGGLTVLSFESANVSRALGEKFDVSYAMSRLYRLSN